MSNATEVLNERQRYMAGLLVTAYSRLS